MKELNFNLKLTFSEKVRNDDEIEIIANNVLDALVRHINTAGITPDDADFYTENVSLSEQFSGISISKQIV